MKRQLPRRQFLFNSARIAGAAALFPTSAWAQVDALGEEEVAPPARTSDDRQFLRVLFNEPDGNVLQTARVRTLHARDMYNDPLPQAIITAPGRARIELADEAMQVSLRLSVPGFGEVYCYADNNGHGYTRPGNVTFVVEAAATRLRRVRDLLDQVRISGASIDDQTLRHVAGAARPVANETDAYAALADGLHAGERLTLIAARQRISRFNERRRDFRFGCMIAPYDRLGEVYERRVRDAFNFATVSWYTWGPEHPVQQRIDYGRMDRSIAWCLERGIEPKNFGYVYMARGATPEWLREWPYEKILPEYVRVVQQTTSRYDGRVNVVEVINEAHDKANLWRLSQQQILELTRQACAAAREGSSTVQRQINNCCMWAEYAKRRNEDGSRRWSPFTYIRDCIDAGVEFEVLGLQLYYPQHDVMEIERMLDRFVVFNRPIHITEIATASQDGLDPTSMRPTTAAPGWHGPWSESTQADWLEAVYTIIYSKAQFAAIGWWDLADIGGHFWPFGGMLRADLSPKQAYGRLIDLQRRWGLKT